MNGAMPTVPINSLNVQAKLISVPQRIGKRAPLTEGDDEKEYELLYNKEEKVFYSYMTSGTFLANVKASGYLELTKAVEIT